MSEIGARSVVAFHFLSFFSSVSIRERARSRVFAGQVSPFLNQQLGDDDWVFVSLLLETKHVNYLTVINWPSYSRRPSVTNDTGIIARARSLAHPIRCKGEPTNREKKLGKRCTSFLSLSILCLSMFSPSAVHEGQPLGAPTSVRISSSALFNIIGPCFHSALYWFCTEFHQHNFFRGGGLFSELISFYAVLLNCLRSPILFIKRNSFTSSSTHKMNYFRFSRLGSFFQCHFDLSSVRVDKSMAWNRLRSFV